MVRPHLLPVAGGDTGGREALTGDREEVRGARELGVVDDTWNGCNAARIGHAHQVGSLGSHLDDVAHESGKSGNCVAESHIVSTAGLETKLGDGF